MLTLENPRAIVGQLVVKDKQERVLIDTPITWDAWYYLNWKNMSHPNVVKKWMDIKPTYVIGTVLRDGKPNKAELWVYAYKDMPTKEQAMSPPLPGKDGVVKSIIKHVVKTNREPWRKGGSVKLEWTGEKSTPGEILLKQIKGA